MDFLDYESDEHEDNEKHNETPQEKPQPTITKPVNSQIKAPVVTAKPPVSKNDQSVADTGKKKKTLDISFLPKEIQEALIKGIVDSDDDDEDRRPTKKPTLEAKKSNAPVSADPLLQILPPPKNSKAEYSSSLFTHKTVESKSAPKATPAEPTTTATTATTTESSFSYQKFLQEKNNQKATSSSSKNNINLLLNPNFDMDDDDDEDDKPTQQQPSSAASRSNESSNQELSFHDWKNHKKKRERDIEQHLMYGDTSVITEDNINIADVQADHSWDALNYANKQEREAQIMNTYTNDGQLGTQPNRLQNRRHQLSSLAMKAAQTEIALLEARGTRMKTKAQTQAKYGW